MTTEDPHTPNTGDSSADTGSPDNESTEDPQHKPSHPYDVLSTYRYYRDSIVETLPLGRTLWDIARITLSVMILFNLLLFLTGLSAPFVAVSSGSMEPNIMTGDFLIITEYPSESPPPLADSGTIVTVAESQAQAGSHMEFNRNGDVIVFSPRDGSTPILHRAHFWVDSGENWVEEADPALLPDNATCARVEMCPAPNAGYITAGDNNPMYDQLDEHAPVEKSRIIGVAQYRVPYLGWIRIGIDAIV